MLPTSAAELNAMIEQATRAGYADGLRQGRMEGRMEAEREAALAAAENKDPRP